MSQRIREGTRDFLHIREVPGAHRVAVRAGVSVLVPLLAVIALGHPEWSAYAVFGAFTSLYGRNHVHLSRAAMQTSAGAALTTTVVLGVLVGSLESRAWLLVAIGALAAGLGSMLASAQDWHPPGPLFLVFAFGAVASVPHTLSDVQVAAAVAVASAGFAVLVGNVGAFVRGLGGRHSKPGTGGQPGRPAPAVRLAPVWTWEPVRCAVAALAAGSTATAVGIGHSYWAMVAAVAPLSARGIRDQLLRAAHRIVGTLLGLVTAAALLALDLGQVAIVLVVAVLQIVTELLIGRNYGLALLFITPMALLMGQVAAPRPMGQLLFDRGVETVIGALIGGVIIVLGERTRRRRMSRPQSGV